MKGVFDRLGRCYDNQFYQDGDCNRFADDWAFTVFFSTDTVWWQ